MPASQQATLNIVSVRIGKPAAVSHEPDVCSKSRKFDVHRDKVVYTASGVGTRRRVGEPFARLEIGLAIEAFLKRIQNGLLRTPKNLDRQR